MKNMITDPIADFLTRIRNALALRKTSVRVLYSRLNYALASKLLERGYLAAVEKQGRRVSSRMLELELKYLEDGSPAIRGLRRVSRPSRRVYQQVTKLKPIRQGTGLTVLSTPQGLLSFEEAKAKKVGGELLFVVW